MASYASREGSVCKPTAIARSRVEGRTSTRPSTSLTTRYPSPKLSRSGIRSAVVGFRASRNSCRMRLRASNVRALRLGTSHRCPTTTTASARRVDARRPISESRSDIAARIVALNAAFCTMRACRSKGSSRMTRLCVSARRFAKLSAPRSTGDSPKKSPRPRLARTTSEAATRLVTVIVPSRMT